MQEGSIVVMVKPVEATFWEACKRFVNELGKMPPEPGSTQYMVTGIANEEECKDAEVKFGIYLDSHPTYEKEGIPFDGELFVELLPPSLDVNELVNSVEVPEKGLVLAP